MAEIRLDNPSKLNALTVEMLDALEAHCARIDANPDIRVVLLTSEGEKAFCVGANITEWASLDPRLFARDWVRRGHRVFDRLARLPVPVIGVLEGHAFGGGLELAAACDLRVITPHATIALPETGIGIVPGWSGTQRLAVDPALPRAWLGRRDLGRAACFGPQPCGFLAACGGWHHLFLGHRVPSVDAAAVPQHDLACLRLSRLARLLHGHRRRAVAARQSGLTRRPRTLPRRF